MHPLTEMHVLNLRQAFFFLTNLENKYDHCQTAGESYLWYL